MEVKQEPAATTSPPVAKQVQTFAEYLSTTGVLKELATFLHELYENPPKSQDASVYTLI